MRDLSIGVWKLFAGDLQLHEAKKTQFTSLHDCFVRELKDGARAIDPIAGRARQPVRRDRRRLPAAFDGSELIQAKGSPYTLDGSAGRCARSSTRYRDGLYVTLRLTSSMYHRFHAPYDCEVERGRYISGDTWNVNPIALRRVARLFCKNERAVVRDALRGLAASR